MIVLNNKILVFILYWKNYFKYFFLKKKSVLLFEILSVIIDTML